MTLLLADKNASYTGGSVPKTFKEKPMNLDRVVSELKSERNRIDRAIRALSDGVGTASPARTKGTAKPGSGLTAAGRRRLSEAMKARWAARRSSQARTAKTTGSNKRETKRTMSPAARKRISAALKKRWAEKKKAPARKSSPESASTGS